MDSAVSSFTLCVLVSTPQLRALNFRRPTLVLVIRQSIWDFTWLFRFRTSKLLEWTFWAWKYLLWRWSILNWWQGSRMQRRSTHIRRMAIHELLDETSTTCDRMWVHEQTICCKSQPDWYRNLFRGVSQLFPDILCKVFYKSLFSANDEFYLLEDSEIYAYRRKNSIHYNRVVKTWSPSIPVVYNNMVYLIDSNGMLYKRGLVSKSMDEVNLYAYIK